MSTLRSNSDNSILLSESQKATDAHRILRADIARIDAGDYWIKSLMSSAKHIKEFSTRPESNRVFTYEKGKNGEDPSNLNLDKVLSAMVTYSRGCGGGEDHEFFPLSLHAMIVDVTYRKHLTVWELVHGIASPISCSFVSIMRRK